MCFYLCCMQQLLTRLLAASQMSTGAAVYRQLGRTKVHRAMPCKDSKKSMIDTSTLSLLGRKNLRQHFEWQLKTITATLEIPTPPKTNKEVSCGHEIFLSILIMK